jgi:predicted GNAT family acetyltransferase
MDKPQVRHNEARHRFELEQEGHTAIAEYELSPGFITFTHTLVPKELEGRGVGSALAAGALAAAREKDLKVIAQCEFIAAYIKRHPEVQDLVQPRTG